VVVIVCLFQCLHCLKWEHFQWLIISLCFEFSVHERWRTGQKITRGRRKECRRLTDWLINCSIVCLFVWLFCKGVDCTPFCL
jgi:hypothetical protein